MKTKEFRNNDEERGGYIIGEQLGLTQDEVDAIVIHFSDNEIGFMSSTLGLQQFNITQRGIMYLESLEEEPVVAAQIQNNHFNIGSIHSPTQFQVGTHNSTQTQEIYFKQENVNELFDLIKKDIVELAEDIKQDFNVEMEYLLTRIKKGKDIKSSLSNIGTLISNVGINVFANLIASPIFEVMKPFLGLQ